MHASAVFAIVIKLLPSVVGVLHHLVKVISSSSGELKIYLAIDGYAFSIKNSETIVENLGSIHGHCPDKRASSAGNENKRPKTNEFLCGFVTRFEIFKLVCILRVVLWRGQFNAFICSTKVFCSSLVFFFTLLASLSCGGEKY